MKGYLFSEAVRGATHKRDGLECQDYAGSEALSQTNAYAFAVADGHGDSVCQRSALGSRFAVEVALNHLTSFANTWYGVCEELFDSHKNETVFRDICISLASEWQRRTRIHFSSKPLDPEQQIALGVRGRHIPILSPSLLYGTTLVAGLITRRLLLVLQQGDGWCVLLDNEGHLFRPMPEDERCIGHYTSSLCDSDAGLSMRYCVFDLDSSPIVACFVGSDGVEKSLYGSIGLFDFCCKIALNALEKPDQRAMEESLSWLLGELSSQGCGDDASLAGYIDVSRIAQISPMLAHNRIFFLATSELEQGLSCLNSMKRMYERYSSIVPETTEEKLRRDAFLAEYKRLENRIRELNVQIRSLGTVNTTTCFPAVSSSASTMSSFCWEDS